MSTVQVDGVSLHIILMPISSATQAGHSMLQYNIESVSFKGLNLVQSLNMQRQCSYFEVGPV